MRLAPGPEVQSLIANLVLGDARVSGHLGEVTLHAHQRDGAERVRHLLATHGGALVADDVGLGKTYLAIAVAKEFQRPLLIAPAAVRASWAEAMSAAQVALPFTSLEAMSRGAGAAMEPDLVVIDEAHHLRNHTTLRHEACRNLCAHAKVLLLSATPVQNRLADLRNMLSLFLGERAQALTVGELMTFVVRRESGDVGQRLQMPGHEPTEWLQPGDDGDCLSWIEALPPPLAAANEGDGGALLTYTLVKQWASSRAALRSALSRRIARAHALEDALSAGRMPTRAELGAWTFVGGSQQLAIPLIAATTVSPDSEDLLARVRAHREAVQALASRIATEPDPDEGRADRLRELCAAHPGRRVVAFSEYADTVAALFRLLSPHLRVAMLTHSGGRVAAGRTTRRDLLDSFAPGGAQRAHERDRVDLLLTTDVLSEGVGLHDASIVVHLDIPWNPARMTQRVGRVRRLGSTAASVLVFAMAPPVPAARMLDLETRLRRKVADAARAIGITGDVLPGVDSSEHSAASRVEQRAAVLQRWRSVARPALGGAAVCGAVRGRTTGALACVRLGGVVSLVAIGDHVTDDAVEVDRLVHAASAEQAGVDDIRCAAAVEAATEWLRQRRATGVVDLSARRVARSRRDLLRRTDHIARAVPRHARALLTPMILAARGAAAAPLSAGAEQVLHELSHAALSDEAWLRAVGEFAAQHASPRDADEVLGVLLLVAESE
jgi:superfamily II DNA or RNA helicase